MSAPRFAIYSSAALLGLLLVTATGCGSSDEAPPAPNTTSAPGSALTPPPVAQDAAAAAAAAEAPAGEPDVANPEVTFDVVPDFDTARVDFISTKNGDVEVPGMFTEVIGGLYLDPDDLTALNGVVNVQMGSVDTGLEARDLNIRSAFFRIAADGGARADVDVLSFEPAQAKLAVGKSTTGDAGLKVRLLGTVSPLVAKVKLERLTETEYHLTTVEPLAYSILGAGLNEQHAALKTLCGHAELGDVVKLAVDFKLVSPK